MKEKSKIIEFDFPVYDRIPEDLYDITALYLRVSTDTQAQEGYGLDVQYDQLKKYCLAYEIENPVVFVDDGYTGMNELRPAFQKLLELMRRRRIKFVMTYTLDRIARLQMPILRFLKEDCVLANCDFLAVKDNIDSRNKQTYNILISILSMFAELDHDAIVAKLYQGRRQRAMDGFWKGGGIPPFGYTYSKEVNNLIPDDRAPLVKKIFEMYNSLNYTPRQIAQAIGLSSDVMVFGVLKNRTYLGEITFRGEQFPGKQHPLIDEETFYRAQEILKSRSVRRSDSRYLLSSLIFCGVCGARMRYMKWGRGEGQTLKIVCYSKYASSKPSLVKDPNCSNGTFDAGEVERHVIAALMNFAVSYQEDISRKIVTHEEVIGGMEARLEGLEQEYNRLLIAFQKLGNDDVLDRAAEVDRERKKLQRDIEDEREKQTLTKRLEEKEKLLRTLPDTWASMTAQEKQNVVRSVVEKVILTRGEVRVVLNKTEYEKKS